MPYEEPIAARLEAAYHNLAGDDTVHVDVGPGKFCLVSRSGSKQYDAGVPEKGAGLDVVRGMIPRGIPASPQRLMRRPKRVKKAATSPSAPSSARRKPCRVDLLGWPQPSVALDASESITFGELKALVASAIGTVSTVIGFFSCLLSTGISTSRLRVPIQGNEKSRDSEQDDEVVTSIPRVVKMAGEHCLTDVQFTNKINSSSGTRRKTEYPALV